MNGKAAPGFVVGWLDDRAPGAPWASVFRLRSGVDRPRAESLAGRLPFRDVAYNGAKGVEGLPGLLADCLPDGWGRRVARRMIFNVLASNLDDHGENHAFQLDEATRTWSLTSAYDLTFSPGILQRGMTVAGEVWPSRKTMESLCLEAGLTAEEYNETLQSVKAATRQWKCFAEESSVPAALTAEVEQRLQKMRREVFGENSA